MRQMYLHALLTFCFFHNSTPISATELSLRQERATTSTFIFTSSHSNPSLLDGSYEGLKFPRKTDKSLEITDERASQLVCTIEAFEATRPGEEHYYYIDLFGLNQHRLADVPMRIMARPISELGPADVSKHFSIVTRNESW